MRQVSIISRAFDGPTRRGSRWLIPQIGVSAHLRVRIGKLRRFGRDDQISRQRQLERAGVAMPMHGGNDRLRQVRQPLDRLGLKIRLRRALALRDVGEIVPGGEAFARAAHDHQPDALGLARDLVDVRAQFDKHLDVERVEFLGTIQRERCETVPVFAKH